MFSLIDLGTLHIMSRDMTCLLKYVLTAKAFKSFNKFSILILVILANFSSLLIISC